MTKVKAIALSLFVAGFCASYAFAGNGHGNGHGKSDDTTSTSTATAVTHGKGKGKDASACHPNVAFVLNGTFVSAAADGSFSMTVTHANHHAKALGSPATVGTDANTRIRRDGKTAAVTDLVAGDRLNVQARGCKNVPAGTAQTLVAKRVVAHPAAAAAAVTTAAATATETEPAETDTDATETETDATETTTETETDTADTTTAHTDTDSDTDSTETETNP